MDGIRFRKTSPVCFIWVMGVYVEVCENLFVDWHVHLFIRTLMLGPASKGYLSCLKYHVFLKYQIKDVILNVSQVYVLLYLLLNKKKTNLFFSFTIIGATI